MFQAAEDIPGNMHSSLRRACPWRGIRPANSRRSFFRREGENIRFFDSSSLPCAARTTNGTGIQGSGLRRVPLFSRGKARGYRSGNDARTPEGRRLWTLSSDRSRADASFRRGPSSGIRGQDDRTPRKQGRHHPDSRGPGGPRRNHRWKGSSRRSDDFTVFGDRQKEPRTSPRDGAWTPAHEDEVAGVVQGSFKQAPDVGRVRRAFPTVEGDGKRQLGTFRGSSR